MNSAYIVNNTNISLPDLAYVHSKDWQYFKKITHLERSKLLEDLKDYEETDRYAQFRDTLNKSRSYSVVPSDEIFIIHESADDNNQDIKDEYIDSHQMEDSKSEIAESYVKDEGSISEGGSTEISEESYIDTRNELSYVQWLRNLNPKGISSENFFSLIDKDTNSQANTNKEFSELSKDSKSSTVSFSDHDLKHVIEGSNKLDVEILSETLAELYLEQGYKLKGIEMYKKLIQKYPEKASIFAARIESIQNLKG